MAILISVLRQLKILNICQEQTSCNYWSPQLRQKEFKLHWSLTLTQVSLIRGQIHQHVDQDHLQGVGDGLVRSLEPLCNRSCDF